MTKKEIVSLTPNPLLGARIEPLEDRVEMTTVSVIDMIIDRIDVGSAIGPALDPCHIHCEAHGCQVCGSDCPSNADGSWLTDIIRWAELAMKSPVDGAHQAWIPVMEKLGFTTPESWQPGSSVGSDGVLHVQESVVNKQSE